MSKWHEMSTCDATLTLLENWTTHLRSLFTKVTSNYHFIVHYWFSFRGAWLAVPFVLRYYRFGIILLLHISLFLLLLYVECLAFSAARARSSPFFLCSSVRKVVLKPKWMMIIKSPICLMALCYSFCQHTHTHTPTRKCLSVRFAGVKSNIVYVSHIYHFLLLYFFAFWFFYWIFGPCVHCVERERENRYSISVCQSFAYRHFIDDNVCWSTGALYPVCKCLWCGNAKWKTFLMLKQLNRINNTRARTANVYIFMK